MTTTAVARRLLVLLLCILAVGGCATIEDLADLGRRVEDAGYRDASAYQSTENGYTTLTVEARMPGPRDYDHSDVEKIATIVWETYPHDFDVLLVVLNGSQADALSREELGRSFGPRDAQLVRGQDTRLIVVIVVVTLYAVLMAAIAVIVFAVLRRVDRRERERSQHPPYPGPTGYWWPPPAHPPAPPSPTKPADPTR